MNITEAGVVYCSICPDKTFESEDLHRRYVATKDTKGFYCQNHLSCTEKFTKHELVRHCNKHGIKIQNWNTFFREALQAKVMGRYEETCEICFERFENKNDLETHYETHKDQYTCQVCNIGFKKVMDYVYHAQSHHEKELFTCPLCGVTREKKDQMKKHIGNHDQLKRYKCNTCGSRFAFYWKYCDHVKKWCQKHTITHKDDKQYKPHEEACEICFKLFEYKYDLETHYETHEDQFSCQLCKVGFKKVMDYVCHAQVHHKEKLFTCPVCGITRDKRAAIRLHMDSHDQFKRYKCKSCGSRFAYYSRYANHIKTLCNGPMKTHKDDKQYNPHEEACEICFEFFKNKNDLEAHYETHEDKYTCEVCIVGFKRVMDYICHSQGHHEKKLFTCPLCGVTREKKDPMRKHIERHYEFSRYKCSTCGIRFPYYSRYYDHVKMQCN